MKVLYHYKAEAPDLQSNSPGQNMFCYRGDELLRIA